MLPVLQTSAGTIDEYYNQAVRQVRGELDSMSYADLEPNNDDELLEYFASKVVLQSLEQDPDPARSAFSIPDMEPSAFRASYMGSRQQQVLVTLPLVPKESNVAALQLRASQSWPLSPNLNGQASFRSADHVIELRVPMSSVQEKVGLAKQMIGNLNNELERWVPEARKRIQAAIAARRSAAREEASQFDQQYEHYQQTLTSLGITLKRNPGAVEPVNVQVKKSIQVLRKAPAMASGPSEPFLVPDALQAILRLIDQAGKGFEKAPEVFRKLGEEDLRTVILGYLNAVYAWPAATGETFSKTGKADILLNHPDGAVLVAECHKWDGPELYRKKIEQLFGYLTWRHTVGVMVTFSENKGLTEVVEKADVVIQGHPSYKMGFIIKTATYRVSTHEHPDDQRKQVEIHHLFFNLFAD